MGGGGLYHFRRNTNSLHIKMSSQTMMITTTTAPTRGASLHAKTHHHRPRGSSLGGRARKHGSGGMSRRSLITTAAAASSAAATDDDALESAYTTCGRYTKESSATFYFATTLMGERERRSVWAIYSWCRILDETVDGVEAAQAGGADVAAEQLRAIETQLKRIFSSSSSSSSSLSSTEEEAAASSSTSSSPETIALADTIRNTPGMSEEPFLDMIAGMRSDLSIDPDAIATAADADAADAADAAVRFKDWPELRRYCYNVAGTVGLMTLPVMGVAEGYTLEDATPPGVDLGIALQLTNILRDVVGDGCRL